MMRTSAILLLALLIAGCRPLVAPDANRDAPAIIPTPQHLSTTGVPRPVPDTLRCSISDESLRPLIGVVAYEYEMLLGRTVVAAAGSNDMPGIGSAPNGDEGEACRLEIDSSLAPEEYVLSTMRPITVSGGSYDAVAMGTVSLMHIAAAGTLPEVRVHDRPDRPYRGLLIDVARRYHELDVLKQLVLLARWYKINYLQLHLTDDQAFTFPSASYPQLPTPGHHYTRDELRELDDFARRHGVGIVPELEVPGHAGRFVENMPDVFGIFAPEGGRPRNPHTINMGRERAYDVLDDIVGEISDVFRSSPYIHIGGDEASLRYLDEDPDALAYMDAHSLGGSEELYRHFIVRMDEIVKRHGRKTIVWEGFASEGELEIPRDILVMAWETIYQLPQDLLDDGYEIVNASWVPLYVVNEKKWDPSTIYDWNLWRWENWVPKMPSYTPIQIEPSEDVIGASMESWDQPQHIVLWSLRKRVPAMNERVWNASLEPRLPWGTFEQYLDRTDAAFQRVLSPVRVEADGLRYPGREDGHYNEPFWFGDRLTIRLRADSNQVVRYTLDGSPPTASSPAYGAPITVTETTDVRVKAFTPQGDPIGYDRWIRYELHPVEGDVKGDFVVEPDDAWEIVGKQAVFSGMAIVHLHPLQDGVLRYTTDGSPPRSNSTHYRDPLQVDSTVTIRAQLFDNQQPVGSEWTIRLAPANK